MPEGSTARDTTSSNHAGPHGDQATDGTPTAFDMKRAVWRSATAAGWLGVAGESQITARCSESKVLPGLGFIAILIRASGVTQVCGC